jgi:FKBP-type peptidyl-prolyl cis-trans isomerase FkpA
MSVTAVPIRPLKKGAVAKLWIGIAALSLAAGAAAWQTTGRLIYEKTPSGSEYQVVENGEGPTPGANDLAKVHVTIRERGRVVQDSRTGEPPEIPISQLPPPIAEVLQLMNKGATYRLRLTPEQAGAPPGQVRPGAQPLKVELTLVEFRALSAEEQRQMQMMQMMQQQMQQGGQPGGPGGPPGGPGGAPGAAEPGAGRGAPGPGPEGGAAGRGAEGAAPPPTGNSSR